MLKEIIKEIKAKYQSGEFHKFATKDTKLIRRIRHFAEANAFYKDEINYILESLESCENEPKRIDIEPIRIDMEEYLDENFRGIAKIPTI